MERAAFLLFDLIICAVEGYLYYNFCAHFFQNRFTGAWKNAGIVMTGMFILYCINQYRNSIMNLLTSGILFIGLCFLLFKDSTRKRLYIWFISWFIMIGCEFLVVGILHLTWGKEAIMITGAPIRTVLYAIMTKILNLIVFKLICSMTKTSKDDQYPATISLFFCIPIASFAVCVGLCYLDESLNVLNANNIFLMFGCILLLAANAIAFIICDHLILAMNQVKEYEIMETKRQLEAIHYKSVNDMNDKVKTILHSMNGVIQTVDALLQNRETEQIDQIMSDFRKELSDAGQTIYCSHPLIDAILSEKARIAYEQNISYQVFVESGFVIRDMKSIDLISLISNLIDNAIEAASRCNQGFIDIKMFRVSDGEIVVLKIKNNFVDHPAERGGNFMTRKQNPSMHGIGVRQVKKIVEQYEGNINFSYENQIFEVVVHLFME